MGEPIITKDGRFVQMFNKLVDIETGLSTDINSPNPIFVSEMYKSQFTLSYEHSLMESTDLFSKMRKLIYPLLGNEPNYIMEYEMKYGQSLLVENEHSTDTLQLIEEAWDFVKLKLVEQYPLLAEGIWDDVKGIAGKAWDKVKEAGAWVLNKGLPWFMEKLENFMLSPVGIGLDVALTAIGVGKLATGILWGILGIWKIYQLMTGKIKGAWAYIDIAVCFVGLIFSGAAKGLKTAFTSVGGNIAKMSPKFLGPLIEMLAGGAGKILSLLAKPFEWLASVFGTKAESLVSTAKRSLGKVFTDMKSTFNPTLQKASVNNPSLKSIVSKGIKQDITNPLKQVTKSMARQGAIKGAKVGTGFYALNKGIEYGADKYKNYSANKSNQEIGKVASAIPDDVIKQGIEGDMGNLLSQMN
jgi:hypothetical protein